MRLTALISAAGSWLLLSFSLSCAVPAASESPKFCEDVAFVQENSATQHTEPRDYDPRQVAAAKHGSSRWAEAAITRGLVWLAKNQHDDGKWQLDGKFPDKGVPNDIAGTAFGLLPMLAAGKTHKPGPENPFDTIVDKALSFLVRQQEKKTGELSKSMYSHALATTAVCEAYGLTKDPALRPVAEKAIKYIVEAQHEGGGWRYAPDQKGDTSVTGFQVRALMAAKRAGIEVPHATLKKVQTYLDSVVSPDDEGYGYVDVGSTPSMSAVGLLCRRQLSDWGPKNPRLIKGIENHLKKVPPGAVKNIYYYYYATQVMYNPGGDAWKEWNEKMRDGLVDSQVRMGELAGSWDSRGDAHGEAGGRLMQTSLSLLTLEIYYCDAGEKPAVVEVWPGKAPDEPSTIGPEKIVMSPKLTRKEVEITEPTRMITNVTQPTLTIYRPAKDKDTGTAMLICPGGGYWNLFWELEGEEVAAWLTSQGVTGIILKYRVPRRPDEIKGEPARRPLQDAQRAVSLVRSKAKDWGIDPNKIGMIGFSAGGHLAIATATNFDKRTYEPIDDVDKVSCRPDFAILAYSGYLKAKDKDALAPGLRIPAGTPPVFLVHGSDDIISPPGHSVVMYLALKRAGIPAELHIYANTAHDFAVRPSDRPCSTWTRLCEQWLRQRGFLMRQGQAEK